VLQPSPLVITDSLFIDGDPLNRGAGGITIDAGSELWNWESGVMLRLRGDPKSFITVTLEDISLEGSSELSFYNPGGIAGPSPDFNMVRSSIAKGTASRLQSDALETR
jgi:hypothetical protein